MSASQLSPVNKILTTLAAVLSLAKRYKLIKSNLVDNVERLNLSSEADNEAVTPDKVYNKEELKKLIEATEPGTLERVIVMFRDRGLAGVNALKPFHRKQIRQVLDAAIEKAQIKRLTPRRLRHTFCSLLIADRIPVTEVPHYAGHKDPSVTLKVYAHFVPRETAAIHNLAESILQAQ
jgi:integrase